jgi:hypothetical protein
MYYATRAQIHPSRRDTFAENPLLCIRDQHRQKYVTPKAPHLCHNSDRTTDLPSSISVCFSWPFIYLLARGSVSTYYAVTSREVYISTLRSQKAKSLRSKAPLTGNASETSYRTPSLRCSGHTLLGYGLIRCSGYSLSISCV